MSEGFLETMKKVKYRSIVERNNKKKTSNERTNWSISSIYIRKLKTVPFPCLVDKDFETPCSKKRKLRNKAKNRQPDIRNMNFAPLVIYLSNLQSLSIEVKTVKEQQ